MLSSAVAILIIFLALAGGIISGKLEHTATTHFAALPVTTAPSTSTSTSTSTTPPTTAAPSPEVLTVRAALINDMTLDVLSQRLDADPTRRAALAQTPAAVARRHADVALAWAPDKVADTEARYDASVRAASTNPAIPSITDAAFVVTRWDDVTVSGSVAHASCRGHYRLTESGGPVEQPDRDWHMTLSRAGGQWRLEDRSPPA